MRSYICAVLFASFFQNLVILSAMDPIVLDSIVLTSCPTDEEMKKIKENNSANALLSDYYQVSECGSGFWKQVIYLNMSDTSQQCPSGWNLASSPRSCAEPPKTTPRTCSLVNLTVNTTYSKVCGNILGLAQGSNDAFASWTESRTDRNYVDGITIFRSSSPPQHVWTFATDHNLAPPRCPCSNATRNYPFPAYVGSHYFCDIHVESNSYDHAWDGSHCLVQSGCCNFNSPPWFIVALPNTSSGNLEVSICGDESTDNESIRVQKLVLYVQ